MPEYDINDAPIEDFVRIAAQRLRRACPGEYNVVERGTYVTVYSSIDKAAAISQRIRRAGFVPAERCAPSRKVQWVNVRRHN